MIAYLPERKNHEKLIALLLSVLLALTSMAPAYAAKPYLENQNFSIEASIDELADGITFAIIQEADGSLTVQKIEQSDIPLVQQKFNANFCR